MKLEEYAKIQAAQQVRNPVASECNQAIGGAYYGDVQTSVAGQKGSNQAYYGESPKQELLIDQLLRKLENANSEHVKLSRVINILDRHPEFEEFLELIRSGLV